MRNTSAPPDAPATEIGLAVAAKMARLTYSRAWNLYLQGKLEGRALENGRIVVLIKSVRDYIACQGEQSAA
jgi:hypothetical protein